MPLRLLAVTLVLVACAAPAVAELGFYGWGPRLGAGDDPDQVLIGVHQDLGEFVENLRFQVSFDVGFGDDHTTVSGLAPVHYRFPGKGATPYVGGGVLLGWIDRDRPGSRGSGSEFEIAPVLVGGVELHAGKSGDALLELQLPGGELHDAKLFVGWMLRAR